MAKNNMSSIPGTPGWIASNTGRKKSAEAENDDIEKEAKIGERNGVSLGTRLSRGLRGAAALKIAKDDPEIALASMTIGHGIRKRKSRKKK